MWLRPEHGENADAPGIAARRLDHALREVQTRFTGELASDLDCVNTLVEHIEQYRGKMLRPTLVLAAAGGCGVDIDAPPESHLVLATVVEMVHMATLVHDDILDEAQLRRGGGTINELSGNEAAVMLGDYLISHAYHLCSSLDDPSPQYPSPHAPSFQDSSVHASSRDAPSIARALAAATNVVCEGELLQLANRHNTDLNERTYFEIIRRKTASLCGVSCELAARLCGADEPTVAALTRFGEKLGLAFQIIDDVLDITGDPATVGKTLGRDLQKGKLTLPLIRYLDQADDQSRAEVVQWLEAADGAVGGGDNGGGDDDGKSDGEDEDWRLSAHPSDVAELLPGADLAQTDLAGEELAQRLRERVLTADVLDYCRQWARTLVETAKAPVQAQLPPSPARKLLLDMADAVLTRRR